MVTALVKANIHFDSFYYPNKNHGIGGGPDNTTFHLWSMKTNWILKNLGNENTKKD
jgi:dipeptidyl-peptidase-4